MRRFVIGLVIALFSVAFWAEAQEPVIYDGSQLLRGRKGRVVYNIVGGEFDGKRGYLFRIANQSDAPVILNTIPDSFSEPVLGFLSNGSTLSDGTASFEGRTNGFERIFDGSTEILNVSPTTEDADRPFNFIVVVEPTVDELTWFFRGREKLARAANSAVEDLDLSGGSELVNTQIQFIYDEGDFDGSGEARYLIDNVEIGAIPMDGIVEEMLTSGSHTITAINRYAAGSTTFDVTPGGVNEVEVRLNGDGLANVLEYELRFPNEPDGIFAPTTFDISLGFFAPDGTQYLVDDVQISAQRIEPGSFRDGYGATRGRRVKLDSEFSVQANGIVQAISPQNVISQVLAMGPGPYMFEITANDLSTQLPMYAAIEFDVSRHSLNGTVLKLPDSPAYDFSDVIVKASSSISGSEVTISPNGSGDFDFGLLPVGAYQLEISLQVGDEFISSIGEISLEANTSVQMTPLTVAQAIAGEESFFVDPSVNLNALSTSQTASAAGMLQTLTQTSIENWPSQNLLGTGQMTGPAPQNVEHQSSPITLQQLVPGTSEFRVGAGDGDRVTETFMLDIPGDQEVIGIAYMVSTFVGVQGGGGGSRWSINVRDENGLSLFNDSAVFGARVTREGLRFSRLGNFEFTSNIAGEALNLPPFPEPAQQRTLIVTIQVVSDGINETAGQVTFSFVDEPFIVVEPEPEIELEITKAAIARSNARGSGRPRPRQLIDGDTFSVPDNGERNFYDFRLPVRITRLDTGATLGASDIESAGVELEYVNAAGTDPILVFENSVDQVNDGPGDEIEVQVAFFDPNPVSPTNTSPPIADNVQHKISLTAMVDGQSQQVELDFGELIGLYDAGTDIVATTGGERGGDKWSHKQLYDWLEINGLTLLNAVNDISGQHGVDIGHRSHKQGLDVDMRFFGDARRGSVVYESLRDNVFSAIRGNPGAEADVRNFISDQHDGLDALEAEDVFDRIIGPHGQEETERNPLPGTDPIVLPVGWAAELFIEGTVSDTNGNVILDINDSMSAATEAIYDHNNIHNDHYHLDFVLN